MTDTSTTPAEQPAQQAVLDLNKLIEIGKQIGTLDEQISASSGSEAAMRKSVTARYATENSGMIDQLMTSFLPQLAKLELAVLVGFLDALPERIEDEYGEQVKQLVDGEVKRLSESTQSNVGPLREKRKTLVEQFKAVRSVLDLMGIETSSVPDPKRGGGRPAGSGSSGSSPSKTGKNKDHYRFTMNGERRPPSQNSFSSLAYYATMGCVQPDESLRGQTKTLEDGTVVDRYEQRKAELEKAPERWGVKQLKDFLAENSVTYGPPGQGDDNWEVELPNKTKIGARRLDSDQDEDIYALVAAAKEQEEDEEENGGEESEETPQEAVASA